MSGSKKKFIPDSLSPYISADHENGTPDIRDDLSEISEISDNSFHLGAHDPELPNVQSLALDEVPYERDVRLINVPNAGGRQLYDPNEGSCTRPIRERALYDVPGDSRRPSKPGRAIRTRDRDARRGRGRGRDDRRHPIDRDNQDIKVQSRAYQGDPRIARKGRDPDNAYAPAGQKQQQQRQPEEEEQKEPKPEHVLALDEVPYDRNLKYVNVATGSRPVPKIERQGNRFLQQVQSIASGNVGELQQLDQHYAQLDQRKREQEQHVREKLHQKRQQQRQLYNPGGGFEKRETPPSSRDHDIRKEKDPGLSSGKRPDPRRGRNPARATTSTAAAGSGRDDASDTYAYQQQFEQEWDYAEEDFADDYEQQQYDNSYWYEIERQLDQEHCSGAVTGASSAAAGGGVGYGGGGVGYGGGGGYYDPAAKEFIPASVPAAKEFIPASVPAAKDFTPASVPPSPPHLPKHTAGKGMSGMETMQLSSHPLHPPQRGLKATTDDTGTSAGTATATSTSHSFLSPSPLAGTSTAATERGEYSTKEQSTSTSTTGITFTPISAATTGPAEDLVTNILSLNPQAREFVPSFGVD